MSVESNSLNREIAAVRRFNRFYTRRIGVLQEGLLNSPFSLTEVRVLYELSHRERPTASELSRELGLDAGYLSRILRHFEGQGLIARTSSEADARQSHLHLTKQGQQAFAPLNARADEEIAAMLGGLSAVEQRRLVEAMREIEGALGAPPEPGRPYLIRTHQPGDLGWVVHRHGLLYAREYGWDEQFEALVAEIVAKFIRHQDPKRERCLIAEREGEILGSALVVKKTATVAALRLLLVEPKARGQGIGRSLLGECRRFARRAGYLKLTLWTNSVLQAARRLYEEAGFSLVREEPHHSFGHDLIGQTWELKL